VYTALTPEGCAAVPEFAFVGNLQDLAYWRSIGMVGDGPFVLYVGPNDMAVVGIPRDAVDLSVLFAAPDEGSDERAVRLRSTPAEWR